VFSIYKKYDLRRGIAFLIEGLVLSGPLMHWAYNFLEEIIPVGSPLDSRDNEKRQKCGRSFAALAHVVADSIVLDPFFIGIAIAFTGILEGHSVWKTIIPQFKTDYIPTIKASFLTSLSLLPLEFVCFRWLPVDYRSLSVNIIDVIWDGVISFMTHRARR